MDSKVEPNWITKWIQNGFQKMIPKWIQTLYNKFCFWYFSKYVFGHFLCSFFAAQTSQTEPQLLPKDIPRNYDSDENRFWKLLFCILFCNKSGPPGSQEGPRAAKEPPKVPPKGQQEPFQTVSTCWVSLYPKSGTKMPPKTAPKVVQKLVSKRSKFWSRIGSRNNLKSMRRATDKSEQWFQKSPSSQDDTKMTQDAHQIAQEGPKMPQGGLKTAPRWHPKLTQKGSQDRSNEPRCPKMVQLSQYIAPQLGNKAPNCFSLYCIYAVPLRCSLCWTHAPEASIPHAQSILSCAFNLE